MEKTRMEQFSPLMILPIPEVSIPFLLYTLF